MGNGVGLILDSKKKQQLWVPEGFGHGYLVLSKSAGIIYKCTCKYYPKNQRNIIWNDPNIKIKWPIKKPTLSTKDSAAIKLNEHNKLPKWKKKKLILLIGSNGNLGYAIKNKLKKKTYHKKFAFKKDIDLEKLSSIGKIFKKNKSKIYNQCCCIYEC